LFIQYFLEDLFHKNWHQKGNEVKNGNDDYSHTDFKNLARYTIRASFSKERMQYLDQEGTVVYTANVFPAMEWLAAMCSHIPNRGEQMVRHCGFCNTIRDYSSTGNPHSNSKSKFLALQVNFLSSPSCYQ
jgi:hypothetical protein